MIIQLLILQLIAHLVADFVLQPQRWCNRKEKKVFTLIHFYHFGIVLVCSYLLSLDLGFWKAAFVIAIIHFLIDSLKSFLLCKTRIKNLFFVDQILHLVTILGIIWLYSRYHGINFLFALDTKTLAIIAAFVLCAKPANIIIKYLLQAFAIEISYNTLPDKEDASLPNAGKLIGTTERFLTLALILTGHFDAVGFIIAAKSILRFRAAQKSEYVLVGTLLSFSIATLAGILIELIN